MLRHALALTLALLVSAPGAVPAAWAGSFAVEDGAPLLYREVMSRAGWLVVNATVHPGGQLAVAMHGTNGHTPFYSAVYVLDEAGNVLAGGRGVFDGRYVEDDTFVDVGTALIGIPGLPVGEQGGKAASPGAEGSVEGSPDGPIRYRLLAYGGGAGDPDIEFTVRGREVSNVTVRTGPAFFATGDDLGYVHARAEHQFGVAAAGALYGFRAASIGNGLFGYFGVVSPVRSLCTATCVTTQDTAVLEVDRDGRPSLATEFRFFNDPAGDYQFRMYGHVGLGSPVDYNLCSTPVCVETDFTPRPMVVLFVADIPL